MALDLVKQKIKGHSFLRALRKGRFFIALSLGAGEVIKVAAELQRHGLFDS